MEIKPEQFQTIPGKSAMFVCISQLQVEWMACKITKRSFTTKSLPGNAFTADIKEDKKALIIKDVNEDNYGTYCCKHGHPHSGQYYVDWADLVKGNLIDIPRSYIKFLESQFTYN